ILWNDTPPEITGSNITINYSDIEGGWIGPRGTANIDTDPLFADPANEDYHLTEDSPCIDAGTPDTTGLNLPAWDLDGNIRVWDGDGDGIAQIDMGPYEFDAPSCAIDCEQQQIEKIHIVSYPNPVNSSSDNLNIKFFIPKPGKVKIQIFNIKGQLVSTVLEQPLNTGDHTIHHSLKEVSSGIYFMKLDVDGNNRAVKKMVKID
ncbi:MAG: T9SS type A sorting domain-containing protein, partial [Candidatus Cloacimonetes bacterium]|nr:T9SS type A sorting domain-containing protein [Candidatus Cloacimonadota bacterium]